MSAGKKGKHHHAVGMVFSTFGVTLLLASTTWPPAPEGIRWFECLPAAQLCIIGFHIRACWPARCMEYGASSTTMALNSAPYLFAWFSSHTFLPVLLQEFVSMMVPSARRRCSAAEFANTWLQQQQAKQRQVQHPGEQEDWAALRSAGLADIRTTRDQALVGAG